jgi:hypothetical protein
MAYVVRVTGGRWFCARGWRRHWAFAIAVVIACLSRVGRAQTSAAAAQPFRLVWSSSAGCGDVRAFVNELQSRTTRLREALEGEHAITLIVETFQAGDGVRGQLTVRKPDGDLSVREVPGLNCQEVESGMALIAALMVDPLAESLEGARTTAPSRPPTRPTDSANTIVVSDWSLRIEQRLVARNAVAPDLAWGQAFAVMLTGETSGWRPSVALSGHWTHATTSKPSGSAELDWVAAQLTACPIGLTPSEPWDFRLCGTFQIGRLRGVGFETESPATKSILWTAAGLELQGRYRVVGPLWLGFEGAFVFPFSRERFYLEPEETLHQVPAWGWDIGLGTGVRFF